MHRLYVILLFAESGSTSATSSNLYWHRLRDATRLNVIRATFTNMLRHRRQCLSGSTPPPSAPVAAMTTFLPFPFSIDGNYSRRLFSHSSRRLFG